MRNLDRLIYGLISKQPAQAVPSEDLLGRLIAARSETGDQLSDVEIRHNLAALIFGGRETTQWAISWTLAFLAEHPDLLAKAQTVVDAAGPPIGAEQIAELDYLKALMSEAQRLQGMLMLPRQLERDSTIGAFHLPKGTIVGACPYILHRHPDFWNDPETFDPERFLGDRKKTLHRFQHIPFGGGGRMCLGMNLAILEAQIILATFLRRYNYAIQPGWERRHLLQYSLVLDGGLPVTLTRRDPKV